MKVSEDVWAFMKNHLGYSDEEMDKFRKNPINEDVLSKTGELMNKTIVFEVIESKGCNSQHKVGDKLYFDGAGNLLTKLNPKRVCIFALNSLAVGIYTIHEFIYAGLDPNEIKFNHTGCGDVGVNCGGWGRIVMKFYVEDRKK